MDLHMEVHGHIRKNIRPWISMDPSMEAVLNVHDQVCDGSHVPMGVFIYIHMTSSIKRSMNKKNIKLSWACSWTRPMEAFVARIDTQASFDTGPQGIVLLVRTHSRFVRVVT